MEQQPWKQQREDDGGYAMGESSSCHADDLDLQFVCEAEGALLMEDLLPPSDLLLDSDDVDRQLNHVIRSLEAEIVGGVDDQQQEEEEMTAMMVDGDDEGGNQKPERIEDVLLDDLDCGYDYEFEQGASSSSSLLLASGGNYDETEDWCVFNGYEGGGILGYCYDMVDHQYYYCCAEGSADHMYLPLWE